MCALRHPRRIRSGWDAPFALLAQGTTSAQFGQCTRFYRHARHGPIFILSDGSFLTRAHIQTALARTFPFAVPGSMGTHSFRIGGASMLCSLGIPDATVQIMGRWSSNAFRRYMHISDQFLSRVHRSGASRSTSFTHIWQPSSGSSMLRTQP